MDLGLYKVAIRQYLRHMRQAIILKDRYHTERTHWWRSVCESLDPNFSMMDKAYGRLMNG